MDRYLNYHVSSIDDGIKIEHFLRNRGYSRQLITELKKGSGKVCVNNLSKYLNERLFTGNHLNIFINETAVSEKITPIPIPLDILYEDEDVIVVNKPAKMPIHPSLNNYDNTLANGLAYYYKQQQKPFVFRCMNRLDRDTSGVTVISKNLLSAGILSQKIKGQGFQREYIAILKGSLPFQEGSIHAPIGRKPDSIIERCIDFKNGNSAITHFKVLKRNCDHSLVALKLETGRTHQIRVHMKHLGYPLIGDYLYYPDYTHIDRQALHSYKVAFEHPVYGHMMEFKAPLPKDMNIF